MASGLSSSSSSSSSLTPRSSQSNLFQSHFPKAKAPASFGHACNLPEQPQSVGPVFDVDHANQPLFAFDPELHQRSYAERDHSSDADQAPQQPDSFQDAYLMPSLTANERLRLTLVWYYTGGNTLQQDTEFLLGLQHKLDLVQTFMGWEFAIMGLLSEDVYTRVVTSGLPLAILPRRESTCSHTINQPPGSVFMLPNMASDWRFKNSPHVHDGGMRSYAGAQLRCKTDTGDQIALGSLCIASSTEQPPLNKAQQDALARFADMLASEIVARSLEARRRQRHVMTELIAEAHKCNSAEGVRAHVLRILAQIYPDAVIDIQDSSNQAIFLPNHAPISVQDCQNGLWEDSSAIESLIISSNHAKLESDQAIRAIVQPCLPYQYLVVASKKVQLVFDDIDSWFVEQCASLVANSAQESRLRDALIAKDNFLRGITHQLRTPIHGVLGSCELLAEELANRNLVALGDSAINPSAVLAAIRDSGRELMSTVNNMLKLNRWAEPSHSVQQAANISTFNQAEEEIMYEVHQSIPESELEHISILFENQISGDDSMIVMDLSLLKECIQALIINALSYTERGAVIIVISASENYSSLIFDVKDTGCGIPVQDRQRIFEAYEKVDTHTRGAGLGLTLSAKIAAAMDGSVTLVSSQQEPPTNGSHFRAEFFQPGFACPLTRPPSQFAELKNIPQSFHVVPADKERPELVLHYASYLKHQGFTDSDTPEGSMIIVTYTPDIDEFRQIVADIDPRHVALCLIPAGATIDRLQAAHEVRLFSGPFLSSRLEEITKEIDGIYKRLNSDPDAGETATGLADQNDAHRTAGSKNGTDPADADPVALLVDDNSVPLRIMQMYCDKRGIQYTSAVDGVQAVEAFKSSLETKSINLVLMDLQMPVSDGLEATRKIREIEKEKSLARAAIFMITGQDSAADKQNSFDAGADEFFVKPLSLKTLQKGIQEYFPAMVFNGVKNQKS